MFADLWEILEEEASGHGEVRRRIHPESVADLWLVVYSPGLVRALRVAVDPASADLGDLPSGSGIDVRCNTVVGTGDVLEIQLISHTYEDIFDAFVADMASTAAGAQDAASVPSLVAARVRRWQAFLREHIEGLTSQQQRGLFGELHVLSFALGSIDREHATLGWVGPSGAPQDFNFGATAIEVKTSAGKNPQRVRISSERQLDSSHLDHLLLWHVSVDERIGLGETLPEAVQRNRGLVVGTPSELVLEEALFSAGYHEAHEGRYTIGYSVRSSQVFEVRDSFPRLVESDCPPGLGDVHYSIELGALAAFEVHRPFVNRLLISGAGYV